MRLSLLFFPPGVRKPDFSHPLRLLTKYHVVVILERFAFSPYCAQHEANAGPRSDSFIHPTTRRTFDPRQDKTFV
jgi:hypothetical protein